MRLPRRGSCESAGSRNPAADRQSWNMQSVWLGALQVHAGPAGPLTCGATAGFGPPTDIRYIWSFEQRIIGSNGWTDDDQAALLEMVADRRIVPIIDSVRPLDQIREAMRDLIDRKVFGKAVLTV